MKRPVPAGVGTPQWTPPPAQAALEWKLRLITPMFGGSAVARQVDAECPVRAAAIRGHLRFWWRATAGVQHATAEALYAAESALWGSTEEPGKVRVEVSVTHPGESVPAGRLAGKATPREGPRLGYFLFPFQADNQQAEAIGRYDVAFTLRLGLPVDAQPFIAALRETVQAWVTFGGIGARARRGCGALEHINPRDRASALTVRGILDSVGERAHRSAWPYTSLAEATVVLGRPTEHPKEAWTDLAHFWARFRKGHVGGRPYEPMRASKWRDYSRLRAWSGSPSDSIELNKPYLGLPIIYQQMRGAPYAPRLEAGDSGRMASPVILKPLAMADGRYRPLLAILSTPPVEGICIDGRPVRLDSHTDDPVLESLGVDDPLTAVERAARELWGRDAEVLTRRPDR